MHKTSAALQVFHNFTGAKYERQANTKDSFPAIRRVFTLKMQAKFKGRKSLFSFTIVLQH